MAAEKLNECAGNSQYFVQKPDGVKSFLIRLVEKDEKGKERGIFHCFPDDLDAAQAFYTGILAARVAMMS